MIVFEGMSVTYPDATAATLRDVSLTVARGELCLVTGESGSGKSTLLRTVNGLVPHFSGGLLTGRVLVDGRDTRTHPPRELADVVGFVGQDPEAGFVADTVEDELAYGMESIGVAPDVMRRRVEETLDLLGLVDLRHRALRSLSGGEQQRVAIGSVLTTHPSVLVLDEPTSALDPPAAEEVLAVLVRLVHDLGLTVLLAEHRLERVVQYADRVLHLPGHGDPFLDGTAAEVMALSTVVPPVVELGRLAGWAPLPTSVRDARRAAPDLHARLTTAPGSRSDAAAGVSADVTATTRKLCASYAGVTALRGVDLTLRAGEICALMGRNGAGKSTVLAHLAGLREPTSGEVRVGGIPPATRSLRSARQISRVVGLVPQDPGTLLYATSVAEECRDADRESDLPAGSTAAVLDRLAGEIDAGAHPFDLSEGERLRVALAVVLAPGPRLVLLDEPTRGLDYAAKARLADVLRELTARGASVLLATHDVELVAEVAHRVVVLADGEVVTDGPVTEVLTHSPAFAPQVAKVLAPGLWLTVGDVERALVGAP
ncbi:MAG TPA: ATP-binding cassette domain-containing protein [Mycobacteriales bacterium]|nr:ATP-binding cassette domain-containing protein [Mycobacteriales bacterium]